MKSPVRQLGLVGALLALVVGSASCSRAADRRDSAPSVTGPEASSTVGSTPGSAPTSVPGTVPAPAAVRVASPVPATAPMVDGTITTPDGRDRTYHVYVPTHLPDEPVPLLLALHGGIGWGLQYAKNSGFDAMAEANGFIVVFPDGVGPSAKPDALRAWNGGDCCGAAVKEQVDDVTFLSMLIDTLEGEHRIDPHRVFAAGHSNGGIMSYRLGCELADKVVAIGVQSTALELTPCHPSQPVSVLHIHGTGDQNIPIDGGRGPNAIAGVDFNPPIDGPRTFAAANGCSAQPSTEVDATNPDVTTQTWTGCEDASSVEFVTVKDASHAWMGSPAPPNRLVGQVYLDYDSTFEIWSFLANHPRP